MASIASHQDECEDRDWKTVTKDGDLPKHFIFTKPIQKSENDNRDYTIIKLENGLEAVLVHDAEADKAAACLSVAVGHLRDPDDIPGLAHFCEHLLFMGTKQFPKENEYKDYLQRNSGDANAYTAASNTAYYFKVSADALEGALERFAGFFHSPLFSPSATHRELNAVDSENKKNLQSDVWRFSQLRRSLSKTGHPWSKFGTGDRASLTRAASDSVGKGSLPNGESRDTDLSLSPTTGSEDNEADGGVIGKETRRRLMEWWEKEYCAGRMTLAIVGKEPLDALTRYAASLFSPIVNRGLDRLPEIRNNPYGADETGILTYVRSVMDKRTLTLAFPIPYPVDHWRTSPAGYLSHLISHEGEGSLHAFMKEKGWISELYTNVNVMARAFSSFDITILLTKDGLRNYRNVALTCFKYICLLRTFPLPRWVQDERMELRRLDFRFQHKSEPDSYASYIALALNMPTPRDLVISGPELLWDWDEALVVDTLNVLTAENCQIFVESKCLDEIDNTAPWEHEYWYKTEFKSSKLDLSFIQEANTPNDISELFLRPPNDFIPKRLDVVEAVAAEPRERPVLLSRTSFGELWHKKDDRFRVPRAQVFVDFYTPVAGASIRASVMTTLYGDLVVDVFGKYAYDASVAGLAYGFEAYNLGFTASVGGYNDKLTSLLRNLLTTAKTLEIKPKRLAVLKENLKQNWTNFSLTEPYNQTMYQGQFLLSDNMFDLSKQIAVIDEIFEDELRQHIDDLLSQLKYKILINGNIDKDEASSIETLIKDILASKPLSETQPVFWESRILPVGCNFVWTLPVPNPNEANGCVMYLCHVGDLADPALRTTFRLFLQIITEPAFETLRTKEQLGYLVSAMESSGNGYIGLQIVIQSTKDPKFVETRIEAFLVEMGKFLESMDDSTFEKHKSSLITDWLEKLKTLYQETQRFWGHITSGYLDFHLSTNDSTLLRSITKQDVLSLYSKSIDPASKCRSKLSVHHQQQKITPPNLTLSAGKAFASLIHQHNIPIDVDPFLQMCASEPSLDDAKSHIARHWKAGQSSQEAGTDSGEQIDITAAYSLLDSLAVQLPTSDGAAILSPDIVHITDPESFKNSLRLSGPPVPVKPVDDPSWSS